MWRSSNPPWGVVRAVIEDDEYAIVLDDLNDDYREVELTICRLVGGEWDDLFTLDNGGFPSNGETLGGGWVLGADGHYYNWVYGREQPNTSVPVALGRDTVQVVADAEGFWLRVQQDDAITTELRRLP